MMARAGALLSFAFVALFVGRASAQRPDSAVLTVALPVGVTALLFPSVVLTLAVAALAFPNALPVGAGGLEISASDVLLLIGSAGLVLSLAFGEIGQGGRLWEAVKPIAVPVGCYFATMLLAVLANLSRDSVTAFGQRMSLVVLAILAGAALADRALLNRAIQGYVAVTSLLAAYAVLSVLGLGAAPETFLGVQKNPAGGAISVALLLVVASQKFPFRAGVTILLSLGLLSSLSRGAIIGTLVALAVVAIVRGPGRRLRDVSVIALISGALAAAYNVLPKDQQDRLLDVQPGTDEASRIRTDYATDAIGIFRENRWFGVGPGNYNGGPLEPNTPDPHNVTLLTAAEGGVVMVLGAAVLLCATAWLLLRRARHDRVVLMALAVQVGTVVHGVVDVYWVRNTPVLSWFLVGAALALCTRRECVEAAEAPRELQSTQ